MDLLAATLTPLIAVVTAYIAYQQWRTNALRHKHELFDRRFEIYKAVQRYLSSILQEGSLKNADVSSLLDAHQRARFLFGKEFYSYIGEIYRRSIEMRKYELRYQDLGRGVARSELVEKEHQELKWLVDQLPVLAEKCEKYLRLT